MGSTNLGMERKTNEQGYDGGGMLRGEIPSISEASSYQETGSISPLRRSMLPRFDMTRELRGVAQSFTSAFDRMTLEDSMPNNLESCNATSQFDGHKANGFLNVQESQSEQKLWEELMRLNDTMPSIPKLHHATLSSNEGYRLNEYLHCQESQHGDCFLQSRSSEMRLFSSLSSNFTAQGRSSSVYTKIPSSSHAHSNVENGFQKLQQELYENQMGMWPSTQSSVQSCITTPHQTRQNYSDFCLDSNAIGSNHSYTNPFLNNHGLDEYHYKCQLGADCEGHFANRRKLLGKAVDEFLTRDYRPKPPGDVHYEYNVSQPLLSCDAMGVFSNGHDRRPRDIYAFRPNLDSLLLNYRTVDGLVGRVNHLAGDRDAWDRDACHLLEKIIDEGSPEKIQKLFDEIIDHVLALMIDYSGSQLISKLFKVGNDDQRMRILDLITRRNGAFLMICCHQLGSRALQYVINSLKAEEQQLFVSSLKYIILALMKDDTGNYVVKCCLQCFLPEHCEVIFNVVNDFILEIARDRQGCHVLQNFVQHLNAMQKQSFISHITSEALSLSQDQYGNYVVQYILEHGCTAVKVGIFQHFTGKYVDLSVGKHSSHVVEKCLKSAENHELDKIILELMTRICELSQNQFGNFVIQSAYKVSKGTVKKAMVEAVKLHDAELRCHAYGQKVLITMRLL